MSLFRITPDNVETFTLETYPRREYSSGSGVSSSPGITGTLYVYPRRSPSEKEVHPLSAYSSSLFGDVDLSYILETAKTFSSTSNNNFVQVRGYMSGVYAQQPSARKQQTVIIDRFNPPFSYNKYTGAKLATINTLYPYYRATQQNANFSLTNYNCFNFFTASSVPSNTVVMYPNPVVAGTYNYGQYTPTGSWTIDFWINPKYTIDATNASFKAGAILHLSGVYAVSLLTGSSRDINGYIDSFGIQVQLSSSANILPSLATTSQPLVFRTNQNVLKKNTWNHVSIRHSSTYNNGTGSILINGSVDTEFVFTGTLAPSSSSGAYGSTEGPIVLCVGNFYEGNNTLISGMSRFFSGDVASRDGLYELNSVAGVSYPAAFSFNHPLNAEVHDLKIFNKYLTDTEVSGYGQAAPASLANLLFYVPPFFTREAPSQSFFNGYGGVMATPFQTKNGTTEAPFNVTMSFGVGGMYMNLENFGKDFATNRFPRWLGLTGSVLNSTADILSANDFLFATSSNVKRQYTILPCDNGKFVPNFNFLSTGSLTKFTNDLGNVNLSYISLRDLLPAYDKTSGIVSSGSIVDSIIGASPDNLSGSYNDSLAIFHRTKDNTSNQVCFFDISNLYFGAQVKPGTFLLSDSLVTGSSNKFTFTIKDDGLGNLYRADAVGTNATWASVGNIFYNEGIILLKSPQYYFFGKNNWEMSFQGKQDIHVTKFNLTLPPLMATSSSNPSYMHLSASTLANDYDNQYVYISTINLHDENLNVINRTSLAQNLLKRTGDKFMLKIKVDF